MRAPLLRDACSSSPATWHLTQVDRALVKNVLDIYIRVGMDSMDAYEADFEADLLSTTATFYKRKVRLWLTRLGVDDTSRRQHTQHGACRQHAQQTEVLEHR